jgi:hypothetical protein
LFIIFLLRSSGTKIDAGDETSFDEQHQGGGDRGLGHSPEKGAFAPAVADGGAKLAQGGERPGSGAARPLLAEDVAALLAEGRLQLRREAADRAAFELPGGFG